MEATLADEGPVFAAVFHVRIEAAVNLRHNDGNAHLGHIAFDGGSARPDGIVVGEAVRQEERRMQTAFGMIGHTDLRRGLLRENNGHGRAETEYLRVKATLHKSHVMYPLSRL